MVYVREGNVAGGLAPADGDAAHFGLETKWNGMDAGYFRATPCDALNFGDEPAPHQRLERVSIDVDKEAKKGEKSGCRCNKQRLPPPAADGRSRKFGH